jgi:hypothetical protein
MKGKEYAKAVEAYKNALKNNPNDDKTRYNFALAKKMNKDNPEKKDDKKDKDKKDDKKEEPKEDKKDDQTKPKDEPKDQPKPQPSPANQQRMKSLLDAVNNEEKKTQDKVNAKKTKGKPTENDKDW